MWENRTKTRCRFVLVAGTGQTIKQLRGNKKVRQQYVEVGLVASFVGTE